MTWGRNQLFYRETILEFLQDRVLGQTACGSVKVVGFALNYFGRW